MTKIKNECVGCGRRCIGDFCPHRNVVYYYCDRCKSEVETLYEVDGEELCSECKSEEEK